MIWKAILFRKCWICISIFTESYKQNQTHIFIHPQALPHPPTTTPRNFVGYKRISVLNLDNSGDILWVCWMRQRGIISFIERWLLHSGFRPVTARPSIGTDLKPKTLSKTIGYFKPQNKSSSLIAPVFDWWPKPSPEWCNSFSWASGVTPLL